MSFSEEQNAKDIKQMQDFVPEIVWIATWKGHKARISSKQSNYPNWIHEHAQEVNWRCIKGREHLKKSAPPPPAQPGRKQLDGGDE